MSQRNTHKQGCVAKVEYLLMKKLEESNLIQCTSINTNKMKISYFSKTPGY